jgi:hypothetical protein
MAVKTYIVTVPGGTGGGYYIDGVQKPVIPVVTGGTYRFNQNAANNNGHPLILSTTTSTAGIISTGVTYYLDGASNQANYTNTSLFNAATVRYVEITVAQISDFYYICNVHGSSMGNTMDVTVNTWGTQTWGFNQWNDLSNLDFSVTGIPVSLNLNSVTANAQINQGWGSDTWGTETWGISGLDIQLTGIALTLSSGSLTTKSDTNFNLTGQQATVFAGTGTEASSQLIQQVTGLPMGMTLQFEEVVINLTGIGLTTSTGTAIGNANTIAAVSAKSASTWNGNYSWGFGVWGNEQVTTLAMSMQEGNTDPAPDVSLTGNAAAMFLGEETITGDANLDLTGISLTFILGTAVGDANTIASPSGILLSMQEGDEGTTANARVNLTGNALTTATGTVYNLIWNQVNTGTTSAWTEVDTAA